MQGTMNEGAGQTCTITIEKETTQMDQGFNSPHIKSATEEHLTLLERANKVTKSDLTKKEKNEKIGLDAWTVAAAVLTFILIIIVIIALFMLLSSDFSIKISTVGI
ncbi:hypothetical protein NEIG_00458 [Nematocida sp. ERTm5]|nr:hypothetical protein NEIG_00458 [Nematocida sp. ERTm5]